MVELAGLAEVLVELERQGFSGEEIIKAIDATGATDATTLTNAMICEFEYSSELPYNWMYPIYHSIHSRETLGELSCYTYIFPSCSFSWSSFWTWWRNKKSKRVATSFSLSSTDVWLHCFWYEICCDKKFYVLQCIKTVNAHFARQ